MNKNKKKKIKVGRSRRDYKVRRRKKSRVDNKKIICNLLKVLDQSVFLPLSRITLIFLLRGQGSLQSGLGSDIHECTSAAYAYCATYHLDVLLLPIHYYKLQEHSLKFTNLINYD